MKKRIGVVPKSQLFDMSQSNMSDIYCLGNNYCKRVLEAGAIPLCVTPVDNWVPEESLAMYDGYIVQGGSDYYPYHFQIVHDAVVHHKPYLGICLGEQLIYAYFVLRQMVEEQGYQGDLVRAICSLLEERGPSFSVLQRIPGHRSASAARGSEDKAKHDVSVVPGTILHRLVGRTTIRAASFHDLNVPPSQNLLTVNAWSADGAVEGVEYGDHMLGVQFHPEVDNLLPEIFSFLTQGKTQTTEVF